MKTKEKVIVTGALGYSGKIITEKLLKNECKVKSLTNSTHNHNPFGDKLELEPFHFEDTDLLRKSMLGYETLINTYWVRFNHKNFNHSDAVSNTIKLFDCAKEAGIKRIIHVSITNPSSNSDLEYFKGKGVLEEYLQNIGIQYSIIRPAVLFGKQDILINNIAWMVRHLPLFGVFGKGDYKLQPIYIEDFADLIIDEISKTENAIINAIGPETFTYRQLVETIMEITGIKKKIINVSPNFGYLAGKIVSSIKGDVTITKEEIKGLMDNLLYVNAKPTGTTKLSEWIKSNRDSIGTVYASELSRRK